MVPKNLKTYNMKHKTLKLISRAPFPVCFDARVQLGCNLGRGPYAENAFVKKFVSTSEALHIFLVTRIGFAVAFLLLT